MKNLSRLALLLYLSFMVVTPAYAQVDLGTSGSATNPQRSGDATTGLFSSTTGAVSISSGGTEMMRVNGSGVGIGTTGPLAPLDVRGLAGNTGAMFGYGTTGVSIIENWPNIYFNSYYDSGPLFMGTGYAGAVNLIPTTGDLAFLVSTASGTTGGAVTFNSPMYIKNNGNVGIGTTSPSNIVSLGGASAQTFWMERGAAAGNSLTVQAGGGLSGGTNENGGNLILSSGISTGTGASAIGFTVYPAGSSGDTDNTPITAMTITGAGNVGIGTTSPANSLTVDGIIQSLTGGFKFPDGTTQTTAATPGPSPGMVLLATVNASAASSVSFGSSYITSSYNKYVVEFDSVYGSSNGADLYLTISTNNGSSYLSANYLFSGSVIAIAVNSPGVGAFSSGSFGASQFTLTDSTNAASLSSSSTVPSHGHIAFSNPSASKHLNITWDMIAAGNSSPSVLTGGGYNTGTTAINAIQFTPSSGTLTGNFHLYGLSGT
jgi:hypothetical protein